MSIKFTKVTTFFDRQAVIERLSPAARKYLGWAGGLTRKIARRSLKQARQKKLSEMTDIEKEVYQQRVEWAAKNGLPKPRRPEISAEKGKPPLLHMKPKSPLKELLFYGLDLKTETTVVGPKKAKSGVVEKLERTHPTMKPALDLVTPQLTPYWKNLIST
tara:strand:- start:19 stop:498 length:480 start_codon:yes stop_codon:yes gene_type:complete